MSFPSGTEFDDLYKMNRTGILCCCFWPDYIWKLL